MERASLYQIEEEFTSNYLLTNFYDYVFPLLITNTHSNKTSGNCYQDHKIFLYDLELFSRIEILHIIICYMNQAVSIIYIIFASTVWH